VRERIIGVLSITHHECGHFTERHAELAHAVARQVAIAIENAQLYEAARGRAALEERQHLARELHDSVSQALYGIALGARTARTLLDRDPTKVAQPLDYVLSLAEAGLAEMRALIFELRPESLELEGLVAALEKQAASLRARHGLDVALDLGEEPDLPLSTKEALYRIAQEATHNVVKHAQAKRVQLKLRADADGTALEIEDDGVGFDPTGAFPGHLGLRSMRERVEAQRGALALVSAPGAGTSIRVRFTR
jgi:signal transduction histidine kinase